jgi:alcohol dehydrogenase (cytochrome c)
VKFPFALSIAAVALIAAILPALPGETAQSDWPSYNRTLTSERYSTLDQINVRNVANLKVVCTYDTKQETGFDTGLVQVDGALIATTEQDVFSIDPDTCRENWRTHENISRTAH